MKTKRQTDAQEERVTEKNRARHAHGRKSMAVE
jgi:hypothetical protein